jgi:transcriptional regulator GlxA family with amidase domain
LARLFRTLHGVSPAAYLRMKRIRTAERLIERSNADLSEIAERSGFGSRWSMFRELRRRRGMSGQRIRESWVHAEVGALSTAI